MDPVKVPARFKVRLKLCFCPIYMGWQGVYK